MKDIFTHYLGVDFALLIKLVIFEHLLRPQVAEEHIVIIGADHQNGILHFVKNVKELLLLVQNVAAFQVEASLFAFKSIACGVTQKCNH